MNVEDIKNFGDAVQFVAGFFSETAEAVIAAFDKFYAPRKKCPRWQVGLPANDARTSAQVVNPTLDEDSPEKVVALEIRGKGIPVEVGKTTFRQRDPATGDMVERTQLFVRWRRSYQRFNVNSTSRGGTRRFRDEGLTVRR